MTTNPYETPETEGYEQPQKAKRPGTWPTLVELLAVMAVIGLVVALLLPNVRGSRETARRMQCANNLKQIALALQNYHDEYGSLPPAYTVDAAGKPLHSWRTLILPFIEYKALYERVDLTKPWDDPANLALAKEGPAAYQCPSGNASKSETYYLAVVAPGGCFKPTEPRKIAEITDGAGETLMVVEVASERAVPWMSPNDATEEMILSELAAKRTNHPYGSQVVYADGHVQLLTKSTDPKVVRAMISAAGNDSDVVHASN